MARKKRRRRRSKKSSNSSSTRIVGLVFILLGLLGLFKLGFLGRLFANFIRIFCGDLFPLAAVLFTCLGFYLLGTGKEPRLSRRVKLSAGFLTAGLLLFCEAAFFQELDLHSRFISVSWQYISQDLLTDSVGARVGGGMLGALLYTCTYFLVSQVGSYIISILLIAAGLLAAFNISWSQAVEKISHGIGYGVKKAAPKVKAGGKKISETIKEHKKNADQNRQVQDTDERASEPKRDIVPDKPVKEDKPAAEQSALDQPDIWNSSQENDQNKPDIPKPEPVRKNYPPELKNYKLPPLSLLKEGQRVDQASEEKIIKHNEKVLKKTFDSFGVDVELKNTILGPSVTKYELHPAIGVKVSKIVNLADDLALALAAKDIRIEAPIPGKSLIGIEVPNQSVATVAYKDVITEEQKHPHKPLEVPIGRNISGKLVTADLSKMPHLLIAGSTGSGKSVAINDIIVSLLMNNLPTEVKLVLVDPKKVELGVYNDIPHLLTPVVTDPKKAARSLNKIVKLMEQRYEEFANTGQRKIENYNEMIARQNKEQGTNEPQMPYVVCILDELSDLMMVASKEVEAAIIRIAQMGRAAGIHLILATQRPSVDVITGLIKANVPSRMAFAVSSGTDSRTIIDQSGAEKLLGRGDMLFLPMGMSKPVRVQGAFVPDADVKNVVSFIKKEAQPDYDDNMEVTDAELSQDEETEDQDELYDEAVAFVRKKQKCSISLLQRQFKIGYNRSARIVDDMEKHGIVGPAEGSKPRQVYLKPEESQGQ